MIYSVTYRDPEDSEATKTRRFEGNADWGSDGLRIGDCFWRKSQLIQVVEEPASDSGEPESPQ